MTVTRTGNAFTVRAPGFGFIKGEPLVRLKDGRSVRVDLELDVLPGARRPGRGAEPADLRPELRSLGRTIRRHAGGRAVAFDLAPDVGGRRGLVPRAAGGAGERARPPRPRAAVLDSLGYRSCVDARPPPDDGAGDFTLRGTDRRAEPAPQNDALTQSIEAGPFRLRSDAIESYPWMHRFATV